MTMPTMNGLRESSMQSALAPIAVRLDSLRLGVRESQELESLTMKIAALCQPHRLEPVAIEVDRRLKVFADAAASSATTSGNPRVHALQSVLEDLVNGRFS